MVGEWTTPLSWAPQHGIGLPLSFFSMMIGYLINFFPPMFQSGLFDYALECSLGEFVIQMSGDSENALFIVMFKLSVTSFSSYHEPAIRFNTFNDVPDLHFKSWIKGFIYCIWGEYGILKNIIHSFFLFLNLFFSLHFPWRELHDFFSSFIFHPSRLKTHYEKSRKKNAWFLFLSARPQGFFFNSCVERRRSELLFWERPVSFFSGCFRGDEKFFYFRYWQTLWKCN